MIAFLDQQLRDIEVLGVEVTHYGSGPIQAVVPRMRTGPGCAAGVPNQCRNGPGRGSERPLAALCHPCHSASR